MLLTTEEISAFAPSLHEKAVILDNDHTGYNCYETRGLVFQNRLAGNTALIHARIENLRAILNSTEYFSNQKVFCVSGVPERKPTY